MFLYVNLWTLSHLPAEDPEGCLFTFVCIVTSSIHKKNIKIKFKSPAEESIFALHSSSRPEGPGFSSWHPQETTLLSTDDSTWKIPY